MRKTVKGIIISVIFTVIGMGVMASFRFSQTMRTIGGGLFIIGIILFSLFLYNALKEKK